MAKPGNWGDWAIIESRPTSNKTKAISCSMCTAFSFKRNKCRHEDFIDPLKSWRNCKSFYFKPQYDKAKYWNKLAKERQ